MNQLQQTISTLEIAEMMECNHRDIMRKIEGAKDRKGFIQIIAEAQMGVSDYFIPDTYKDASGKENKCYAVTKMGCDFLANKFTGEKGILFTARYVKRFRDMEAIITEKKSPIQLLELELAALKEVDQKVDAVNDDLQRFKLDMPILGLECDRITAAVRRQGVHCLGGKEAPAYKDRSLRGKVYHDIYQELKRQFGVESYKAIKRGQADLAVGIVEAYTLPIVLADQVEAANEQMDLGPDAA